jgi:Flp pilus assembly protein TadG
MVEFALVVPVFLLVLCGVLDFGFMLFSRMTVINAAREAARAAVIVADTTTIPFLAPQTAQSVAAGAGMGLTTAQTAVTCVAIKTSGSCSFATKTSSQSGDAVKVTVTYPYKSFFPLLFGTTFNLSSTVQMVLE